jgi:hypothetical protein
MKPALQAEYRQAQHQRARQSATIAERFRQLEALTVEFAYLSPDGVSRNREVKFTVNIERAPSVFRLECLNHSCVEGDHDLTELLAQTVAIRKNTVEGEMRCPGWLDGGSVNQQRCGQRIAYTLHLRYSGKS